MTEIKKFKYPIALLILSISINLFATKRYWVGNGSNKNWNVTTNWSAASGGSGGVTVPAVNDSIYFDGGGTGQCIVNITTSIKRMIIEAAYTDTIKQNGFAMTFGSGGFIQNGGTFWCTTGNVVVQAPFTLAGGTFRSTSGRLTIRGNYTAGSGNFIHNNGEVFFTGVFSIAGTSTFYNCSFYPLSGVGNTYTIDAATIITIEHLLTHTGPIINGAGIINVTGDILQNGTTVFGGGTATIIINGTSDQVFNGQTNPAWVALGAINSIKINKTSGTFILKNSIPVSGKWEYINGTVDATTFNSTVFFPFGNQVTNKIIGTQTLNNISIGTGGGYVNNFSVEAGTVLTIAGTLATAGGGPINFLGNIHIQGNMLLGNTGIGGGTGTITVDGTGDQIIQGTATAGKNKLCNLTIDKISGTLTLKNFISPGANFTYIKGTIDATTFNSTVVFSTISKTISGNPQLHNVQFLGDNVLGVTLTDTVIVDGELRFAGASNVTISGGIIKAKGDIVQANTNTALNASTGTLLIAGTSNQTFTGSATKTQGWLLKIVINKPGGTLVLKNFINSGNSWTYLAGVIDAQTYNSTVVFGYTAGGKAISGTHTLYNVCIIANNSLTVTIPATDVLTILGDLTFDGTYYMHIATGTLNAKGNIFCNNTFGEGATTYSGGTATLTISGTTDQIFTGAATAGIGKICHINIDKPSGTLILKNFISASGNWTYTTGIIDASTYTSTVVFPKSTGRTISGTHSLYNVIFLGDNNSVASNNTIPASTVFTVLGELKFMGTYPQHVNTGTIYAKGDITVATTSTANAGTFTLNINGTGNQTWTGGSAYAQGYFNRVTIDKSAGTLILKNIISVYGNWKYTAGTIDATTNNSTVLFARGSRTISGKHTLNNVSFYGSNDTIPTTDTLTVAGELKFENVTTGVALFTGTINVEGAFTNKNTNALLNGNATLNFCGTSNQTISGNLTGGASNKLCHVKINKPSGTLFLAGNITMGNSDWTYINGTVDPGASTLTYFGTGSIKLGTPALNMFFNNFTVQGGAASLTTALNLKGNLAIIGAGRMLIANNNDINIAGNFTNSGTFTIGTGTVTFNGTGRQYITAGGLFYKLKIDKPSGKLVLNTYALVNNGLILTKGVIVTSGANTIRLIDNATSTEGSNLSYVAGPFLKIGNDSFTFPVGDTTITDTPYHPFSITAPAVATASYTAQYFAKNQLIDHPTFTATAATLKSISTCEYWSLTRNVSTATVTPTLAWNANSCNINVFADMRVGAWDGTQWKDLGQGNINGNTSLGTIKALTVGPNTANQFYVIAESKSTTLVASFFPANVHTAPPVVEWSQNYGGDSIDGVRDIIATSDGGYIFSGSSQGSTIVGDVPGPNHGQTDFWIVKLNATGVLQWTKNIGSAGLDEAYGLVADGDGGCTILGTATSGSGDFATGGHGGSEMGLVKLDASGNLIWAKLIGGSGNESGYRLKQGSTGGLFIMGASQSNDGDIIGANNGDWDGVILKTDNSGNILWRKVVGTSGYDFISDAVELASGDIVIAGVTTTANAKDFLMMKLNSTGTLIWQKTFGGSSDDEAYKIAAISGGLFIAGHTLSNDGDVGSNNGGGNALIIKTDNNGTLIWKSVFGGSANESYQTLIPTIEGGCIGFGGTNSNDFNITTSQGSTDNLLVKYTSTGQVEWNQQYGGAFEERIYNMASTIDGGFILGSGLISINNNDVAPGRSKGDAQITKLSAPPAVACMGTSISFTNASVNATTYLWKVNNINAGTSTNLTYTFATAGTYTVSLTASNGGVSSTKALIVQITTLTADAGGNLVTSPGSGITLGGNPTATGTPPFTYLWSPATALNATNISNPISTVTANATYTVTVTDGAGCIANASVTITMAQINPFALLKRELDAGYYEVQNNILYFKYTEEYQSGNLNFKIYDDTHLLKSCPTIVTKQYGENRFALDLTTCSGITANSAYYFLEVTNDKSEKYLLKFKY